MCTAIEFRLAENLFLRQVDVNVPFLTMKRPNTSTQSDTSTLTLSRELSECSQVGIEWHLSTLHCNIVKSLGKGATLAGLDCMQRQEPYLNSGFVKFRTNRTQMCQCFGLKLKLLHDRDSKWPITLSWENQNSVRLSTLIFYEACDHQSKYEICRNLSVRRKWI